jgi:hypothetical protein
LLIIVVTILMICCTNIYWYIQKLLCLLESLLSIVVNNNLLLDSIYSKTPTAAHGRLYSDDQNIMHPPHEQRGRHGGYILLFFCGKWLYIDLLYYYCYMLRDYLSFYNFF